MLNLSLALALLLLALLGVWALVWGLASRRKEANRPAGLDAQSLSALAQPYRGLMAEALEIERDVRRQVAGAPPPLRRRLAEVEDRVTRLIAAALPQARQGTMLLSYLLRLGKDEAQHAETARSAALAEEELERFVAGLRKLRAKVYSVLTSAAQAGAGSLQVELDDALFEIEALEAAFRELDGVA